MEDAIGYLINLPSLKYVWTGRSDNKMVLVVFGGRSGWALLCCLLS